MPRFIRPAALLTTLACLGFSSPASASTVTFFTPDGLSQDLTSTFAAGTADAPVVFDAVQDGVLVFGAGTWHTNIQVTSLRVVIQGDDALGEVVLSGGGLLPVVRAKAGSDLTLDGLTLTDGHSNRGGGVRILGSLATIRDCVITGNTASEDGGGVAAMWDSHVTISHSVVSGNEADEQGGGLFVIQADSELTVADSHITDNAALSGAGIAIASGTFTGYGLDITGNHAYDDGGGLWLEQGFAGLGLSLVEANSAGGIGGGVAQDGGSIGLLESRVVGNSATSGGGWAMRSGQSDARLTTISSNTAATGGGLYLESGDLLTGDGVLRLTESVVASNVATRGGGAAVYDGAHLSLLGDTIVRANIAATDGGGVLVRAGWLQATSSELSDNSADRGGAVAAGRRSDIGSVVQMTGADVSDNTARMGGGVWLHGSEATLAGLELGDNTASDGGGGAFIMDSDVAWLASNIRANVATRGSGLFMLRGDLQASDMDFTGNTATHGAGGGILQLGGNVNAVDLRFWSNTAQSAGAVYSRNAVTDLRDTVLNGNQAETTGGAVVVQDGWLRVSGGLVSGNSAPAMTLATGGKVSVQASDVSGQAGTHVFAGGTNMNLSSWVDTSCAEAGCVAD